MFRPAYEVDIGFRIAASTGFDKPVNKLVVFLAADAWLLQTHIKGVFKQTFVLGDA